MKLIHHLLAATLVLSVPAIPAHADPAAATATYAFVFKDADISQVAEEILGNTLGLSYRVEPGVTGKLNFRIEQRLTKAQLLAAFEAAVANYDVVIIHEGDTLVLKARKTAQIGGEVRSGPSPASTVGYQIRAVPINYGSATEIAKALETVTHADVVLYSSDKLSLILLGGRSEELDNALSTIALFDQSSLSDAHIRFFQLNAASATTVASELQQVLKASDTTSVNVVPMARLNGLFAFSKSTQALDETAKWVAKLDVASQDPTIKVWVYHPRGASAETLAHTLNLVMGLGDGPSVSPSASSSVGSTSASAMTPPTSTAPIVSNDAATRIVADKDTNSIIVNAPEATRVRILNVINEIDREPAQVFIEASILEVSLTKDFSYGVDWKALNKSGDLTVSSFSSSATNFPTSAPGFTVNYVGTDITAAVRALSSKSNVRIVSAPKITTVENAKAMLQVGDQVPIVKQSAQSTQAGTAPLINSIDYRDTGVKLEVTPRITGDNRVSMEVSQEVSSVAKTQTSGIDSPTIKQRKMESKLIVPEGTVVALGGLISSSDSTSDGGVPGFKDIPVVGGLFKGRTVSGDRTELVVLLQAKILRDPNAYAGLLNNLDADIRDMIHEGDWLAPK